MESPPKTESCDGEAEVTVGVDALTEDTQDHSEGEPSKQILTTSDSEKAATPEQYHPLLPDANETKMVQNENAGATVSDAPDYLSPKKSRRVSFPLDARVVSGYMDPPNPWQDGKNETLSGDIS